MVGAVSRQTSGRSTRHIREIDRLASLVVLFLKTSIAFHNELMTSIIIWRCSSFLHDFRDFLCVTESFFQPAVTPSRRELICHSFHQHGRSTRAFPPRQLASDSQTHPSPLLEQSNHNLACCWHCSFFRGSWGPIPGCFLHGSRPWLFFFLHVHLARVSSNLLLTSWLTASLSALPPSSAAIGSLFRAPSTRCRMLLLHCSELSVLTPTAIFDELLLVTVLMTPRATNHSPWHRRHGFPASLPASPRNVSTSRDSAPVAEHTTASPAFVCCTSRVVRCVRHQPPLSSAQA